ncbi:MAG: PLP-dependent aminotransferase family protein [Chromatiales bacterium]|nr:PLP-dependent aminotransferase family protein [Chromatiales bacterium]
MMSSNAPDPPAGEQDFVKGWPHPSILERPQLKEALTISFSKAITELSGSCLNYGTANDGAFMLGHPSFLNALAGFLSKEYGQEVTPATLMSTGGGSMGIDLCCRAHAVRGDYAICEAPTFYLAHQMFREQGLNLREVPLEDDGMDLNALEKVVVELDGKCKLVYTIPIHQNPTGLTMSQAKRTRLAAMARRYQFYVIADEAYQLVNFDNSNAGLLPLFYEDDPDDPRILSVGTFSKLIGPGMKVGWVQAQPALLNPLADIGFIGAGNNPVIFNSTGLVNFLESGALKEHINFVSQELGRKCALLCSELRAAGLVLREPTGGYFVWVHSHNGKMTGRSGAGMSLEPADQYSEYMRLCFAWLTDEQIVEGVRSLRA